MEQNTDTSLAEDAMDDYFIVHRDLLHALLTLELHVKENDIISLSTVNKAYKICSLKYHPDKAGNDSKDAFLKISNALQKINNHVDVFNINTNWVARQFKRQRIQAEQCQTDIRNLRIKIDDFKREVQMNFGENSIEYPLYADFFVRCNAEINDFEQRVFFEEIYNEQLQSDGTLLHENDLIDGFLIIHIDICLKMWPDNLMSTKRTIKSLYDTAVYEINAARNVDEQDENRSRTSSNESIEFSWHDYEQRAASIAALDFLVLVRAFSEEFGNDQQRNPLSAV